MSNRDLTTRSRAFTWLGILLIIVIAAGLRLWRIDAIPPGFHFDESFEGLEAWRILTDPAYRPIFLTGNFGVPPLNAYANTFTFGIFGALGGEAGPTAMRTTAAVFGILGVFAVYLLANSFGDLTCGRSAVSLRHFRCWQQGCWPSCAGTSTSAEWVSSQSSCR